MSDHIQAPPAPLGEAGEQLWYSFAAEYELNPKDLRLLYDAANHADTAAFLADALKGADLYVRGSQGQQVLNPLFAELRQVRNSVAATLNRIAIPADEDDEEGESTGPMSRSESARKAAQARWRKA